MPLTQQPFNNKRQIIALLGALSFFLSALEYMIPKPLPFIRLGLANFPLLIALDLMPFPSFIFLIGIKVIGQALISGTLFSYVFLFSLAGTGVSGVLMYALRRTLGKERISFIGISAAGALASNGVTLVLARYLIFGKSIIYAAAPVLALGIVTGTILGLAAEYFIRCSAWYAEVKDPITKSTVCIDIAKNLSRKDAEERKDAKKQGDFRDFPNSCFESSRRKREAYFFNFFKANDLAFAGFCMMPALLFNPSTSGRIAQLLFFCVLAFISGRKNNYLITLLVMIGIVFFNLLIPYGEILFSIGPLKVSRGALAGGIRRAVTLEALFMLSRCSIRRDLKLSGVLPGNFGEITGEAFSIFSELSEEKNLFKLNAWARRLDEILLSRTEAATELAPEADTVAAMDAAAGLVAVAVAEEYAVAPASDAAVIASANIDSAAGTAASAEIPGNKKPGKVSLSGFITGPRIVLIVLTILAWLPLLSGYLKG